MEWACVVCEYENEEDAAACESCGTAKPPAAHAGAAEADAWAKYVVGQVVELEDMPGGKLRKLKIDVGGSGKLPTVVSVAPNVAVGFKLVVALPGATVGDVVIKAMSIGGVTSEGVLLDAPALGWTGGGAGTAALVPESTPLGSRPPALRPRLK
jgi:tRNA-binding EMAP/Myf-like protein